jgi:diadenylate cyclase
VTPQLLAISLFPNLETLIRSLSAYAWWQVAVELVLIGVVLYWVVSFLRGTRGARLLKGAGVLMITLYVLVRLVADRFELQRIVFLYGAFLNFAFLAIVVVFQPELRRALMRLGETRLFRSRTAQVNELVETLVESATYLSKRRIGAVIAVEREIGLGGIAESGTRLNADISAEMLNTIFWPNSPLHDLGVIISQGRIAYAGVQFPLAESGDLDRELGSRHRAAVGMSQESDAIVVVVSEETGDVSIADNGQLLRRLNIEQFRTLLLEMLGGQGPEKPHKGETARDKAQEQEAGAA